MGDYHKSAATLAHRGVTLNSLKDQLYSLNMRMLLAMQNHNETAQKELKKQIARIQEEINLMCPGGRTSP